MPPEPLFDSSLRHPPEIGKSGDQDKTSRGHPHLQIAKFRAMRAPTWVAAAILALLATVVSGAPEHDKVTSLPGIVTHNGELQVSLYSGFFESTPTDRVHYMLAEAELGPSNDPPLILWLQGGPGASSMMGMFQEFGPYIIASGDSVVRNEYAWTKLASVLVLESPTGVGFSYCQHQMSPGGKCHHNDTSTALLNLESLKRFVEVKHRYTGGDNEDGKADKLTNQFDLFATLVPRPSRSTRARTS